MICDLLILLEIMNELNEMDKGERFAVYCDAHASRCRELKFDTWDEFLTKSQPGCPRKLINMAWEIRHFAGKLQIHFTERFKARTGKGL